MNSIDLNQIELLNSNRHNTKSAVKIRASFTDLLTKDISMGNGHLSDKKKERFYWELQLLLSSGIDIKASFEIIVKQAKNKDKILFEKIANDIVSGKNLSDSLEKCGKFSPYEFHSIRIGEQSGRINQVLQQLASYYSEKIQQRRQIVNAVSYPCVVLSAVIGVVFFMVNFIVPMFADVFKRFNTDLPVITQTIIGVSGMISKYSLTGLMMGIVTGLLIYYHRNKLWFRKYFSSVILKIPLAGDIVRKIFLARFCNSIGLLTSAHNPLVSSLELVGKMVSFFPIEHSLTVISGDVMKGIPLHKTLQKFKIYDDRMISLVKVAEETNQLGSIFEKLGSQYTQEVKHSTSVMGNILEPLMIIFIGIIVAVILVAMYLPMFKLGTAIN